jgi:AraC family transcriptional regulator of arabinose operon
MSVSALRRRNRGAYTSPFSGVGTEFYPLNVLPDHAGLVLHEAGYLPRNDWWEFPNVLSPFWRLYYNFDRGHHVAFGRRRCVLGPDRLMLIPDRQLFHCHGRSRVRTFWLAFSVARSLGAGQDVPIVLCPRPIERELIRELCAWLEPHGREVVRDRVFHHSLALLHLVLHRPEIRWSEGREPAGLAAARRALEQDFARPLSIPALAAAAGMSVRGFSESFRRRTGVTPGRFRTQVRIREAAHLLANTDGTLESIAACTGFPNRDYLSRVFRKVTGETPAAFRQKQRGRGS